MATTTAKGSGSTVNDGATVLAAGIPASDSPVTLSFKCQSVSNWLRIWLQK